MSQLHGALMTTQLPPTWEITSANGLGIGCSLIPTREPADWSWSISDSTQPTPLSNTKLKLSGVPLVMPGPHLAGSVQVVVPFGTTVQPWLASTVLALPGSYG